MLQCKLDDLMSTDRAQSRSTSFDNTDKMLLQQKKERKKER